MNKKIVFTLIILSTIVFTSCKSKTISNLDYDLTTYTYDDIKAKVLEDQSLDLDNLNESDLKVYSKILSYLDKHVGSDSYYIYDAYYVDTTNSHVVKVVLKDYYDNFLSINEHLTNNRTAASANESIIMLTYDKELNSGYEPFLMARNWFSELKSEFENNFGDYYMNSFYIQLDHMVPSPIKESYGENNTDWKHFYTEEKTYEKNLYNNHINIFFPVGTTREDMNEQISNIKPLFYKYCVTTAYGYILNTKDALDKIKSDELLTGNFYYYSDVDYIGEKAEYRITKE
ncbi:hypothetical protein [Tissierella sp. Yu-01]|uniref:hypothetical protein n=1 Tax=Tissierella sp. Yu-01 TaxID=3035694 RepID=UPI00240DCE06|nr:hypothetical protein [Tissierella sp. Yu-01]WFA08032.1 hypothetical protein P3962_09830 [Tissierella sp. Yu-01]